MTAADCANGRRSVSGVQTGACDASGFCLLRTWCPLEAQPQRTQAAGAPAGHGNSAASNATTVVSFTGVEDIQVSLFISVQWVKFLSASAPEMDMAALVRVLTQAPYSLRDRRQMARRRAGTRPPGAARQVASFIP